MIACVHCDELVSLPKSMLTNFIGTIDARKIPALDRALAGALGIDPDALGD